MSFTVTEKTVNIGGDDRAELFLSLANYDVKSQGTDERFNITLTDQRKRSHDGLNSGNGSHTISLTKSDVETLINSGEGVQLTGRTDTSSTFFDMSASYLKNNPSEKLKVLPKKRSNTRVQALPEVIIQYDSSENSFVSKVGGVDTSVNVIKTLDKQVTLDDIKEYSVSNRNTDNKFLDRSILISYIQKNRYQLQKGLGSCVNSILVTIDCNIDYQVSGSTDIIKNRHVKVRKLFTVDDVYHQDSNGTWLGIKGVVLHDDSNNNKLIDLVNVEFDIDMPGSVITADGKTITNINKRSFNITSEIPYEVIIKPSNNKFGYATSSWPTFHPIVYDVPNSISEVRVKENNTLYDQSELNFTKQTDGCVLFDITMDGSTCSLESQELWALFIDPSDTNLSDASLDDTLNSHMHPLLQLDDEIFPGERKQFLITTNQGTKRPKVDVTVSTISPDASVSLIEVDQSNSVVYNSEGNLYNILTLTNSNGYLPKDTSLKVYLFTKSSNTSNGFNPPTIPLGSPSIKYDDASTALAEFKNYALNNYNISDNILNKVNKNYKQSIRPNPVLTNKYLNKAMEDITVTYAKQDGNVFENSLKLNPNKSFMDVDLLAGFDTDYMKNISIQSATIRDSGKLPINISNLDGSGNNWYVPTANRIQRTNHLGLSTNDTGYNASNATLNLTFNRNVIYNLDVSNSYGNQASITLSTNDSTFNALSNLLSQDKISCLPQNGSAVNNNDSSFNPLFNVISIDNAFNVFKTDTNASCRLYSDHGTKVDDFIDNDSSGADVFNVTRRDLNNTTSTQQETSTLTVNNERAFTIKFVTPKDSSINIGSEYQTVDFNASVNNFNFKGFNDIIENSYNVVNNTGENSLTQTFTLEISDAFKNFITNTMTQDGDNATFKLVDDASGSNYENIDLSLNKATSPWTLVNTNIMRTKHSVSKSANNNTTKFVSNKYKLQVEYRSNREINDNAGFKYEAGDLITQKSLELSAGTRDSFNDLDGLCRRGGISLTTSYSNSNNVEMDCNINDSNLSLLDINSISLVFNCKTYDASDTEIDIRQGVNVINIANNRGNKTIAAGDVNVNRGDKLNSLHSVSAVSVNATETETLTFTMNNSKFTSFTPRVFPFITSDFNNKRNNDNGALSSSTTIDNKITNVLNTNFTNNSDDWKNAAWNHSNPFAKDYLKPVSKLATTPSNVVCTTSAGNGGSLLLQALAPNMRNLLAKSHFRDEAVCIMTMNSDPSGTQLDDSDTGIPYVNINLELNMSITDLPSDVQPTLSDSYKLKHSESTCRKVILPGLYRNNITDLSANIYDVSLSIESKNHELYDNGTILKYLRKSNDPSGANTADTASNDSYTSWRYWDRNSFAYGTTLANNIFTDTTVSNNMPNIKSDFTNASALLDLYADFQLKSTSGKTLTTEESKVLGYLNENKLTSKTLNTVSSLVNDVYTSVKPSDSFNREPTDLDTDLEIIFSFKGNDGSSLIVLDSSYDPSFVAGPSATVGSNVQRLDEITVKPFETSRFKSQLVLLEGQSSLDANAKDSTGTDANSLTYTSSDNWLVIDSPENESSSGNVEVVVKLLNGCHELVAKPKTLDIKGTIVLFKPEIETNTLTLYDGTEVTSNDFSKSEVLSTKNILYTFGQSPWTHSGKDYKVAGNSFAFTFNTGSGSRIIPPNESYSISRRKTFIQGTPGLVSGSSGVGPNNVVMKLEDITDTNLTNKIKTDGTSSYGLISFYSGGDHAFEVMMMIDDDTDNSSYNVRNAYTNNYTKIARNASSGRGTYIHRTSSTTAIKTDSSSVCWNSGNSMNTGNHILGIATDSSGNPLVGKYNINTGALDAVLTLSNTDNSWNKYDVSGSTLDNMMIPDPVPDENHRGRLGNSWPETGNEPIRLGVYKEGSEEYILTHLMLVKRNSDGEAGTTKFDQAEMAIVIMDTSTDTASGDNDYGAILVTTDSSSFGVPGQNQFLRN